MLTEVLEKARADPQVVSYGIMRSVHSTKVTKSEDFYFQI